MWNDQILLFILCIPLSPVTSVDVLHVFGYEGREANVSCPYIKLHQFKNKYFCKNDCRVRANQITATETKNNKYSIRDDRNKLHFVVTISELHQVDAGKYWCAVAKFGRDVYTEVRLHVMPDSCCDNVTQIQSYGEDSVSLSCPYESEHQNNLKYVCRGKQPSTCLQQALITSDNQHNGRFALTDDKTSRRFTVTISGVTQEDSGSYLCGVHNNTGLDVFSAVELEVKDAPLHIVVYILPAALVGLLILTVTLVMIYKSADVSMKEKHTEARETNCLDHIYENHTSEVRAMLDISEQQSNDYVCDNEDANNVYCEFTAPEHIYCNQ